ncbi:MAG: sulfotransferase domain-containing protein [Hyphomicrobiales bacterium]
MKTFLLGVGAQKSATTWLHEYTQAHENCDLGLKKEYHIFDALFKPNKGNHVFMAHSLKRVQNLTEQKIKKGAGKTPTLDAQLDKALKIASFYTDMENYAQYFDQLYDANIKTKVVGDITPSYSLLDAEDFTFVKTLLERRGFEVKVIFLMRDPVERAYSAARMSIRDREAAGKVVEKTAEEIMIEQIKSPGHFGRGRYDLTIRALEQVFNAENIHYGFYETLFNDAEVRKITNILGIDFISPDFDMKVNASPRTIEASEESIIQVRQRFEEVYCFCKEKFGEEFIERIWKGAAI